MMQINEVYEEFSNWLDNLLENNEMPDETLAFCFNLYEESTEDSVYGVQLIAADEFDENDGDWPCSEVWSSEEDIFCVEFSDESEKDWKSALSVITEMACDYLSGGKYGGLLTSKKAVGIGFVDGELDLIYKAE